VQRTVTAVSFGSQKWTRWRSATGDDEVLRVSLGRDGIDVDGVDDDALTDRAIAETSRHLGIDLAPSAVRVSRWPGAFPQYRPGHRQWLAAVDACTPPGLVVVGASYRGIGIPACVADAERAASLVLDHLAGR
jgi:oxygen-dependent protoporphyrinogen oxidase